MVSTEWDFKICKIKCGELAVFQYILYVPLYVFKWFCQWELKMVISIIISTFILFIKNVTYSQIAYILVM